MSLHRRNPRRDLHEAAIVKCLRLSGWSVEYLSVKDAPDLILGKNGITLLAEVKTGNGKLRPGQKTWHDDWRGSKPWILRDVEDVLVLNQWSTAASTERSSPFDARTAYLKWRQAAPDSRQPSKPGNITTEVIRKRNGRRTSRLAAND